MAASAVPTRTLVSDVHLAGWQRSEADIRGNQAAEVRARMQHLRERFRPEIAGDLEATWDLELVDHGHWTFAVADGRLEVRQGAAGSAAVARLQTDATTLVALVDGRVDGIHAFLGGRLQIRGDLNLAVRFETLFRPGAHTTTPIEVRRSRVRGSTVLESLVTGHGRPVVLLHGLGANKISFVPTLVGLADAGCEVHALDLPGFGKSDKPLPAGRRYSMGWMADAVNGYLIRHGLRDAVLVGNSMGGRIAAEVALRNPRAVAGITGLGAAVAFDEWQRFGPWLARSQFQWGAALPPPIKPEWIASGIARTLFADASRLPSDNYVAAAEDVLLSISDARYRMATAACARSLIRERAEGRGGFWHRLAGLSVPSLWIWGRRDQIVSSRYAERVERTVPGAEVHVWDGIGHVPQFEAPTETNDAILDFIERVDR